MDSTNAVEGGKTERNKIFKELTRETRDNAKSLEKKLSQLEGNSTSPRLIFVRASRPIEVVEQSDPEDERRTRTALETEAETPRNDKTDRAQLADLFAELSLRLKDELELPGNNRWIHNGLAPP